MQQSIDALARWIRDAERVLFVTGAGISADSGLPTYRGFGGLYEGGPTEEGLSIEEALSGMTFRRDPALTWKYIAQIESACRGARPNAAHTAIAALDALPTEVWVLTQNVDGFHRQAGSDNVIAIHGDLHRLRCLACDCRWRVEDYAALEIPPRCPDCGRQSVRPEVVLFGEALPEEAVTTYHQQLALGFDVVVIVGTSAAFPYIAAPVRLAVQQGRHAVEINPGDSAVSKLVHLHLHARSVDVLPAVAEQAIKPRRWWRR